MKEYGLVDAKMSEDIIAAQYQDARTFVFKIPISNCEALSMMYPQKEQNRINLKK